MADEFKSKNIITEVDLIDGGIPLTDDTKMYIDNELTFRQIKLVRLFDWIKGKMTLAIYPVGAVYMTFAEDNPAEIFGGRWEKIESSFLLGSGVNYNVGSSGGEADVTLTLEQLPSHNHTGTSSTAGNHNHSASSGSAGNHSHTININNAGNHNHHGTTSQDGGHGHRPWNNKWFTTNETTDTDRVARRHFNSGSQWYTMSSGNMDDISQAWATTTDGYHTHTFDTSWNGEHSHGASSVANGSHSHSVSIINNGNHNHSITINSAGSGQSHNNMPPYTVVNIWKRVA